MPRYVALLRGVNVGTAKRVPMADWRALLETQGCSEVRTLLNSGNAVFTARAQPSARLAARIQKDLLERLGVASLTIVKTAAEVAQIVAENRLRETTTDPARLLVAFTGDEPSLQKVHALAARDWGSEALHVGSHAAYLWCADGVLKSALAVALLKGLNNLGTTRNWATVKKIEALLQAA